MMSDLTALERIVNKINAQYGTENFLPAECMYQDGEYYIKAFGKIIWDTSNSDARSPNTVEGLVFLELNRMVLTPLFIKTLESMKEELSSILNNSPHLTENEWTRDMVSQEILGHIEDEIHFFKGL